MLHIKRLHAILHTLFIIHIDNVLASSTYKHLLLHTSMSCLWPPIILQCTQVGEVFPLVEYTSCSISKLQMLHIFTRSCPVQVLAGSSFHKNIEDSMSIQLWHSCNDSQNASIQLTYHYVKEPNLSTIATFIIGQYQITFIHFAT